MLQVILIHNNNKKRNDIIRPSIACLVGELNASYSEVSDQPEIIPVSRLSSLLKEFCQLILEISWAKFHGKRASLVSYSTFKKAKQVLRRANSKNSAGTRRHHAVESIVAAKHIAAWRLAQKFDGYTLIFEDDALFDEEAVDRFARLFDTIRSDMDFYENIYWDFAGGIDEVAIFGEPCVVSDDIVYIDFSIPTTNTACAYLISQKLALNLCHTVDAKPYFVQAPVDWLINGVFMKLSGQGARIICRHTNPPIFQHGSQLGEFRAWRS